MKKKIVVTAAVLLGILILIVAILPFVINANQFKPRVQDELSKALGRQVTVGDLSASIFSGGITAQNISIADDPLFERDPFIQAKSLKIGVDMGALIFSRKVNIRSLDLKSPVVRLLQNQAGRWNFASLGGEKSAKNDHPGTSTSSGDQVSVDKLKIEGGQIIIGKMGEKLRTYNDVTLDASNLSYTTAFPFTVTAKTPGNGTLKIEGKAGPINQQDASATPLDASISIKNLDLATTGFTDPSAGIAGTADFTGKIHSDGSQIQSEGDVTLQKAKFSANAQPSGVPIKVHYAANFNVARQVADITTGNINIGNAVAHLTGTVDTKPASPVLNVKLNGDAMAVQELQDALPAFGVVLPPSAKLQTGTAAAHFQVTGPVDNPVTVGNAGLANAKLANFDLGSKLKGIGSLAGISSSKDTEIQQFSANLHNSRAGSQITNLIVVVPTIGTITGQGTIGANNELDFHLIVKLTGGSVVGGLAQVVGGVSGNTNGIPVTVKGTTQNPQFMPDVGGLAKGLNPLGAQSPTKNVGGLVQGLFGKKKPPK